jgi:predicted glycosyltransferase
MRGLFYHYSPGKDVGHGVHLFRLAAALKKKFGPSLSLTLLRDGATYPGDKSWTYGRVLRPRRGAGAAALLKKELSSGYDFAVTAFFPLGRTGCAKELLPALAAARGAGTRLYCSSALPYFSWPEKDLPRLFAAANLYKRILVHCPPGFDLKYMAKAVACERRVSPAAFLAAFRKLGVKVRFTGYVLPERMPAAGQKGSYILVHRGGGSTSPEIISCAIKAKPLLKSRLPMVIVAGPASSAAELKRWRAMLRGARGVKLLKDTDDFPSLLSGCQVAAGTAGGTGYEALKLRRRLVLVPYTGSPGAEHSDQLARAAMLGDLAGAKVLDYARLTPKLFAAAVDSALAGPAPAFRGGPGIFNGARASAAVIGEDLHV